MSNLIALAFSAFILQNIILTQFLGICPFIGVSTKRSSALGMGMAVIFVMLISSTVTWFLYHQVLVNLEMTYMRTIVFILVIAALVQMVETFLKKVSPALYKALGIYLPLITTNCAVLGVAVLNITNEHGFVEMLVYTAFIGIGFLFVMYIFSMIREKLDFAPVPKAFKGTPIALIVAAILAIIFTRFGGLIEWLL
ncbi:MAG: electron transport complex protein RnfA [Candidatus Izemoplasmatales bacterium]|uniref:Ion-translocating oxidoreductase complex subunit A n=1 Tax=Hujiaoplasma nucleasis TaxID=2725268 RepID=A0A7L6N6P9_9MOLU|nr:RnfABCDGE type electron transport complex subunit A [Hujiaoplasma nucleasis]QLY40918.1 RnfABCDGE type electron transport complex subunit A [Hujiaoplasma nucleasis]